MAPAVNHLFDEPRFHTIEYFLRQFGSEFPDCAALNEFAQKHALRNAKGLPLYFVPPLQTGYERLIDEEAKVATRAESWHDLFNALAWFAFPRAKALLNRLHVEEMRKQADASRRSKARDVLTLYDESGMIVACADAELALLLRRFQWKELFWHRREDVRQKMRFYIFGHALHEQLLEPFKGITGKALIIEVESLPLRHAELDAAVCSYFETPRALESARTLHPVPVLGIPDWWSANEDPSYYDDAAYFRSGRRAKKQNPAGV